MVMLVDTHQQLNKINNKRNLKTNGNL